MTSRDYFKGKQIAVIGLGFCGEMVEDVSFLIKAGALVSIYDLKSEARIKGHLVFLRSIGLANFVCGSIPPDDLLDMDLIILSHEYSRDSSFLKNVLIQNESAQAVHSHSVGGENSKIIPIEYPETLFFKQAPPVTVVGVMGSCGKATVVSMLAPMLEIACKSIDSQGFFVMDPESGEGILSCLKKVKSGDIILLRIVESIMRELYSIRISPHVAIYTTLPQKGSYDTSPFEILTYQTYNNFIIANDQVIDAMHGLKIQPKAKMLRTKASLISAEKLFAGNRMHDRDNAALSVQAARLFKVSDEDVERVLSQWKPLKGRLELVKKVKNVEFYNDTASISPCSTETAIKALGSGRNIVLIFGGAKVKGDFEVLYTSFSNNVHTIVLLPGSGTMMERLSIGKLKDIEIYSAPSIEESVRIAFEHSNKDDRILFSPGFDAIGIDSSRKERGDRFVKAVRSI
ncbi:MAG: hypothetical protein WC666_02935 [Candidatus Paceibacterota bacterium]|jgi:UDP-N-acetylmuramoylalanine-D-glutamate ligase